MARQTKKLFAPLDGSGTFRGGALISGSFTLGSSGALASAEGFFPITTTAGTFGVIKTASKTGRYSFVADRKYRKLRVVSAEIVGPADSAFGNSVANSVGVRNQSTSAFDLQLMLASTGADTDGASGYIVSYLLFVETMGGKS